ncbi:hypothetical protein HAHI6034_03205 [Hathewaya histolytica]|uniref:Uncharacterized protein n=1 Tax=Hathewaya histolytica TaxID=1498 RepID=A0A4U9R280_HATHI|nr:hypothetical protein [Hathewaya histolytica]VTQ85285.1 Uncharacterised protein [Hathewaya histolytica]
MKKKYYKSCIFWIYIALIMCTALIFIDGISKYRNVSEIYNYGDTYNNRTLDQVISLILEA